jgi:ribosomal-protein-alanine acetyltransferase
VRPATLGDVPALVRVERAAFGDGAWTEAMVREELGGPARHYILAQRGSTVVAYGGMFLAEDADIMTIGVVPAERGSGIGRRLTSDLVDAAREAGARAVFLEVQVGNGPALGLYASLGFLPLGTRSNYYGPGRDAVVMRLELRPRRPDSGGP